MMPAQTYRTCSWEADGNTCQFPGTISHVTLADQNTPFYCRWHFDCTDPAFGAQVVRASRDYTQPTQSEHSATVLREAKEFCAEKGLQTVEQKRLFCRETVRALAKRWRRSQ